VANWSVNRCAARLISGYFAEIGKKTRDFCRLALKTALLLLDADMASA
jgi:hypothetical protein